MGTVMQPLKPNDPRLLAWEEYKKSDEYKNSRSWALHEEHVDGSMWAAFIKGWSMAEAALATAERERELLRKEVRRCWELAKRDPQTGYSMIGLFKIDTERSDEVRALVDAAGSSGATG